MNDPCSIPEDAIRLSPLPAEPSGVSMSESVKQRWGIQGQAMAAAGASAPALTPMTIRFQARVAMSPRPRRASDRVCRALNVIVASVAILLAAPLMVIVALLVRLTSEGPAIYRQPRVGVDRRLHRGDTSSLNPNRRRDSGGRIFVIYKFRTMRVDEGHSAQTWASDDDPRMTRVGRVLRSFRLDELPQLFNVLKGDMNIVGPRPEQPEIFAELRRELGHYPRRQRVLPGITGLAQVTLPYDSTVDDVKRKVNLDLQYIRRRSTLGDLTIMAKTMPVMAFRKGSR